MSASTETSAPGESPAPPLMVKKILAGADAGEGKMLLDCVHEIGQTAGGLNRDAAYARLFRIVTLPAISAKETMYFLRPALDPYCQAFYGAHVFQYWLVAEPHGVSKAPFKILYRGAADEFELLASTHKNRYDIVETQCTAIECSNTKMEFDGRRYRPVACTLSATDTGVTKHVSCRKAR